MLSVNSPFGCLLQYNFLLMEKNDLEKNLTAGLLASVSYMRVVRNPVPFCW